MNKVVVELTTECAKFIFVTERNLNENVEIYISLARTVKYIRLARNNLHTGTNTMSRIRDKNV